jgi:hypothetical protein
MHIILQGKENDKNLVNIMQLGWKVGMLFKVEKKVAKKSPMM